jgi:hypothetical protein
MLGNRMITAACAIAMLGGSWYAYAQGHSTSGPRFPAHYREWVVAKGRLVGPNSPNFATGGGFRYIYANRIGRGGYANLPFDEGTTLIDERVEATEDANGVFQEGKTLHVGVMVKDSRRCAETGGWCFNFFTGDDTTVGIPPEAQKTCFTQCHGRRVDTDFVFSKFRKP